MNFQNFTDVGGFPLETETLARLQESYNIFNAFGELVGSNFAIIKGCIQAGSNIGDGYVYINGELLPFSGGLIQANVIIEEQIVNAEFQNGVVNDVYHVRVAKFGTATTQYAWSNFVRAYPMSSAIFIDEVRMFAGNVENIPFGWYLCNGSNGTRDLRKQFIAGLDPSDPEYATIGTTGGSNSVVLNANQIPAHSHTGTTDSDGEHTHNIQDVPAPSGTYAPFDSNAGEIYRGDINTDSAGAHTHDFTTGETGGGQPHENRPAYYTLALIQFKGL